MFWCCAGEPNDVVRLIVRILCGRGVGLCPLAGRAGRCASCAGRAWMGGAALVLNGACAGGDLVKGRGRTCGC